MQKWSPDPLLPVAEAADFVSDAMAVVESDNVGGFRPDHAIGGADVLSILTRAEREQVYDLVEADVETAYAEKCAEAEAGRVAAVERLMNDLAAGMESRLAETLREVAAGTARVAIEIAERIIRARVELDPELLTRLLETMHRRALQEESFQITVHPDDARYLAGRSDLLAKLQVGRVVEDRRVEAGGCLISAGTREWDATLTGQLEAVAEEVTALLMLPQEIGDAGDDQPAAME